MKALSRERREKKEKLTFILLKSQIIKQIDLKM